MTQTFVENVCVIIPQKLRFVKEFDRKQAVLGGLSPRTPCRPAPVLSGWCGFGLPSFSDHGGLTAPRLGLQSAHT